MGVPGAAAVGETIGGSLSLAFLHPSRALALGVGKDGGVLAMSWRDAVHPQQTSITPRLGVPEQVVFAAGADRALLVSRAGIELWAGSISIYAYGADALGGAPVNAALSDDGSLAAVVLDSGRVIEVSEAAVRTVGAGRAVVYAPELFVASADGALSRGGNVVVSGLGPDIELATIGGLVVALGSKSGVSLIDPSTGQLTRVDCGGCQPSHAQALQTPGILYFEDEQRGGLLLDVSSGGPPRIVPLAGIDGRRNQ